MSLCSCFGLEPQEGTSPIPSQTSTVGLSLSSTGSKVSHAQERGLPHCSQLGEGRSWERAPVPAGSVGKGSSPDLAGLLCWLTEEQMLKCSTVQDHGPILH